jgi:hypothetical protein
VRRRWATVALGLVLVGALAGGWHRGAATGLAARPAGQDAPLRGTAEVAGTEGQGLRVRTAADPSAEVDALLPDGTRVEVVEGPVAAGGYTWYRVRYPVGRQTGWAAAAFLAPLGETGPATGGALRGPAAVSGTGAAGLRVRRAPDVAAETRAVLPEGARVEVLEGPVTAGEYAWYRVRYEAGVALGWVAASYLAPTGGRPDARLAGAAPALRATPLPARPPAATPTRAPAAVGTPAPVSTTALGDALAPLPAAPPPHIGIPPELQSLAPTGEAAWPARVVVPASPNWQAVAPLPAVANPDARFGLVEAFRLSARELDGPLGARVQRLTFAWPALQPHGPDALDTAAFPLDWLDGQRARGYRLVGLLLGTPGWAARDPSAGVRAVPRHLDRPWDDPANYWARFAAAVARAYAGRVDDWVIWREPDLLPEEEDPARVTWAGTVDEYYALLRGASRAIKQANPRARVHLAGLTYWNDWRAGRPPYFERLLDRIVADPTAPEHDYYFDVATAHLYTDPRALYHVPRLFRDLMRTRGLDKPVWVGAAALLPAESSPPYTAATAPEHCSPADQAAYVVQAFALGLAGGAEHVAIAQAQDAPPADDLLPRERAERAGLVRADGTLRPAYVAYQTAVRYLQGAQAARYFPGASAETVVVARPQGQRTTVLWNAAPYPVMTLVPRAGQQAELVDAAGASRPLAPTPQGDYAVVLPPATCNSDPADPLRYLVGGAPYLIVEQGVPSDAAPVAPRSAPWPAGARSG